MARKRTWRFIRNVTDSMNYEQLVTAIDVASQALLGGAAKAFNQALVLRNWLIGAHLIEFEQSGQDRATYGEQLLSNLAADLKKAWA